MCTAIAYRSGEMYFGRTLDHDSSYGERVVITPRNYKFSFSKGTHYAMVGMALVSGGYPLYFDAVNEKGVAMAALNFPYFAEYSEESGAGGDIAVYELIPFVLSKCKDLEEARALILKTNVVKKDYSEELKTAPLHFMISAKEGSIVVEYTKIGLSLYENDVEVMTNAPTFDYHRMNLNNYMGLSEGRPNETLSYLHKFTEYSLGMGALGLPGDYTSASRFVRAAYALFKSPKNGHLAEKDNVNQFFHIMDTVSVPRGCMQSMSGHDEYTRYTSCMNADRGVYYYTTYDDREIKKINMHSVDLNGEEIILE